MPDKTADKTLAEFFEGLYNTSVETKIETELKGKAKKAAKALFKQSGSDEQEIFVASLKKGSVDYGETWGP